MWKILFSAILESSLAGSRLVCWWEVSSSSSSNPFVNKLSPYSSLQYSVLSGFFGDDDDLGLCVSLF